MHPTGQLIPKPNTAIAYGLEAIPEGASPHIPVRTVLSSPCPPIGRTQGTIGPAGVCLYRCVTDRKILKAVIVGPQRAPAPGAQPRSDVETEKLVIEAEIDRVVAGGGGFDIRAKDGRVLSWKATTCKESDPCPDRGCVTPCWWWAIVGVFSVAYFASRD